MISLKVKAPKCIDYLGKVRMYAIARKLCQKVPRIKNCKYIVYNGAELFIWNSEEEDSSVGIKYQLYHRGDIISLEKAQNNSTIRRELILLNDTFDIKEREVIYELEYELE